MVKYFKLCNIFLTLLVLVTFGVHAQDEDTQEKEVEVILGIDKIEKLDFAPSTKVQIGNDTILNYQLIPQKREITFKGIKPGKTSIIIRNAVGDIKARYLVTVTASDQSKVVQELRQFLGDIEGLEIGVKGDLVFIGGEIIVPNDMGRVNLILEKYPDVVNMVEMSDQTKILIAKKMQDEIQQNKLTNVTVRLVNDRFWLEGVVTSNDQRALAERIANAYLPNMVLPLALRTNSVAVATGGGANSIIQNFIAVNQKSEPAPIPKLVKITAQFVELTRDYNKIFGFKWSPTLGGDGGSIRIGKTGSGGVSTSTSDDTLSATISNLFPKLASAKSAGHARVIQSGMVVIKDGLQGQISKTSSKPFSVGTGEFTKADTATSGFNLTVKPTVLQEEKVNLNIGVSVSASVGDPPETLSNSVSTEMIVKSKDSAVVGGIVINRSSTDYDKNAPFESTDGQLESGSFLFSFLRSKSYVTNRSQFVVFVTPEIIDNAADGTEEVKRKFRQRRR